MQNRNTPPGSDQDRSPKGPRPDSPGPKELAEVCSRFADICDYFSRQRVDLPPDVLEAIGRVSKIAIPERIARMDQLNQELMEYLHAASRDSGVRH